MLGAVCSDFGTWVASVLKKRLLLGRRREKSSCSNCLMKFLKEVAPSHMMRLRTIFLSISEIDLHCHVDCGTSTTHTVKKVGRVKFQLELGGSLKVAGEMHVPKLKVNLLSGSTLVDEGYEVGL